MSWWMVWLAFLLGGLAIHLVHTYLNRVDESDEEHTEREQWPK